jgi:hypothetical protein
MSAQTPAKVFFCFSSEHPSKCRESTGVRHYATGLHPLKSGHVMIGHNLHARTEEVNTVAMKSDFPCSTRIIESNNVL